jgi:hypothetical protein
MTFAKYRTFTRGSSDFGTADVWERILRPRFSTFLAISCEDGVFGYKKVNITIFFAISCESSRRLKNSESTK